MLKVLIADDDEIFSSYILTCVDWASVGAQVVGRAGDGIQALSLASEHKPDLIIIDVEMPGMSGLECIEKLHGTRTKAEILLVTGHDEFEYAQRGAKHGVTEILLKPISRRDLELAVNRAVSRHWAEHIAAAAIKSRTGDRPSAFISLVEQAAGSNSILALAGKLLDAVREGRSEQIQSALESYLISAGEHRLSYNHSLWLHIFPALLCAELMETEGVPSGFAPPFNDFNELTDRIQQAYLGDSCQSLLMELCLETASSLGSLGGTNSSLAEEVYRNIRQNYSNPKFNMTLCAETMHFSKVYLGRVFKAAYGKSPSTVLKEIRMAEARRLLSEGSLQVQQIAQRVGFEDSSYFSKCFKQYYGYSPSES